MKECRIVEISEDARSIAVERGFLVVKKDGCELGRVELDSLSAVICTANWSVITTPTISALAKYTIPFVVCDRRTKVPVSVLIPLAANWRQADVLQAQVQISLARKKSIWREIVKSKLSQQSQVLKYVGKNSDLLSGLSENVKSGDTGNLEGRGAAFYWREIMGESFRRNRDEENENVLFNYGYTILRAATIRAICAAGLHPSLGVKHCSSTNQHRLADDLIEPFRCFVDLKVIEICRAGNTVLDSVNKKKLCSVLTGRFFRKDHITTVAQMINDCAVNFAKFCLGEVDEFKIDIVKSKDLGGVRLEN